MGKSVNEWMHDETNITGNSQENHLAKYLTSNNYLFVIKNFNFDF